MLDARHCEYLHDPERGMRLGPYEILSFLGAGGMAEVYRARDVRLGRDVALKVLRDERASDPERLKRFVQEARAASALNHPNIVTIHDVGEHDGIHYIAMEYVEGQTLRAHAGGRVLPNDEIVSYAVQMAAALAKAHEAGIVHRDLKPDNMVLDADGLLKVLDFGLSKLLPTFDSQMSTMDRLVTRDDVIVGTVPYMSPEQASGRSIDFRSDHFALGTILYELATGVRPFARETVAQTLASVVEAEAEPAIKCNPRLSPELSEIIHRCLAKDPDDRYGSSRDLLNALQQETAAPRRGALRVVLVTAATTAFVVLRVWPVWEPIRAEARFQELIRPMNFPPL